MTEETKRKSATADPKNYFWIMSEPAFLYTPTRTLMESGAVTQQVGLTAAKAIRKERVCSNLTWAPGRSMYLKDVAIVDGEWFDHPGNNLFNLYRPPTPVKGGDPDQAGPWLELGEMLWGADLPHLLDWLAFKVQNPGVKINHSLVLGSREHGLGKDSWLAPMGRAVGRNNFKNIGATAALNYAEHNYTSFLRSVILRVSEVHDLGERRFKFYELTKDWGAAPPETLTVADKHVKAHAIANVVGVIYTTNHLTDGVHFDPHDRRHFMAWSERSVNDFAPGYWNRYYQWRGYDEGGNRIRSDQVSGDEHVTAFLAARDLSNFDPKAPPPKTAAWQRVVTVSGNTDDAELTNVLEHMGDDWIFDGVPSMPDALTMPLVARQAARDGNFELRGLFADAGKRRRASHRLDTARYVSVANPDAANGYWSIRGQRLTCYARANLSESAKLAAVRRLVDWENSLPELIAADEFGVGA